MLKSVCSFCTELCFINQKLMHSCPIPPNKMAFPFDDHITYNILRKVKVEERADVAHNLYMAFPYLKACEDILMESYYHDNPYGHCLNDIMYIGLEDIFCARGLPIGNALWFMRRIYPAKDSLRVWEMPFEFVKVRTLVMEDDHVFVSMRPVPWNGHRHCFHHWNLLRQQGLADDYLLDLMCWHTQVDNRDDLQACMNLCITSMKNLPTWAEEEEDVSWFQMEIICTLEIQRKQFAICKEKILLQWKHGEMEITYYNESGWELHWMYHAPMKPSMWTEEMLEDNDSYAVYYKHPDRCCNLAFLLEYVDVLDDIRVEFGLDNMTAFLTNANV